MTTATINGVELYFDAVGAGETLVLTHGSWTDVSGWAPSWPARLLAFLGSRREDGAEPVPNLAARYREWPRRFHVTTPGPLPSWLRDQLDRGSRHRAAGRRPDSDAS